MKPSNWNPKALDLSRLGQVACDGCIVLIAYFFSFSLRFDFAEPRGGWRAVAAFGIVVCLVNIAFLSLWGCYAREARHFSRSVCKQCIGAAFSAAVVFLLTRFFLGNEQFFPIRLPYSVTIMTFLFGTAGLLGVRYAFRLRADKVFAPGIDLLERPETSFDNAAARAFIAGHTVLVTGAGGTIGSEIVRQVAALGAKRVLLVERCENALYNIDRAMKKAFPGVDCVPLMLDICDKEAMEKLFLAEKPFLVLHAAAYKHVPMVELNPAEGWRNNVDGTRTVAQCAERHGTRRFVLISTDKAVNPVSVMGKSKREAEKVLMALNAAKSSTSFCAVRFGNVFGSSGSVVPLFREQIAAGGPVTVTDPAMKRYFMTVQEAVSLVLQAASRTERAIYTLEMGAPIFVLKLAEGLIRRAGYRPYKDIPIVFTGMRPGEKLFEELDVSEKSAYRTDMAKIYITKMHD